MRNLLGRLLDRSPQSLALIARFWEIDLRGRDAHQDVGQLYRIMTDPWAFALVWQRLAPVERAIIELLAQQEDALTPDEIQARLGEAGDTSLISLRELYQAGFLFQEQVDPEEEDTGPSRVFLPREFAYLTQRLRSERERASPAEEEPVDLLERLDDVEIAEIAQHYGYRVIPAVALRRELIAYVAPRLADPDLLRDTVRALDPTASRLWSWVNAQGGEADPEAAKQALGLSTGMFRMALTALSRRGILWRGYEPDGALRLVVPEVVRHPRRPPSQPLPALVEVPAREAEAVDWIPLTAAAWDLLTFLRALATEHLPWRADAGGERNATALRRLAPRLWRRGGDLPPTGYVPFLAHLATAQGLLGAEQTAVDRERVAEWNRLPFAAQMRQLVDRWRSASGWPEGAGREALAVWGADWPGFRQRLIAALGELEPDVWYTTASFNERFAAAAPAALGAHFTAAASHEPADESPEARRQAVVRLAAEITLITAAEWLGLIELSRAPRRGRVLRVPRAARWLLVEEGAPPEESALGERPLSVQPDFSVLLLQPEPQRVWALSAFTDLERLDRASIYHLTRASIERGLASGLSLERMTGFLERQAGAPLPENVAFQVAEWARAYRRVRLRRALLVEPDDRSSLDDIERALRAAGLRVERLHGSRLLAAAPLGEDVDLTTRVAEILRALGQTPQG